MIDVVHLLDCTGHGGDALAALALATAQRDRGERVHLLIVSAAHSAAFVDRAARAGVPADELTEIRHDGSGLTGWRRVRYVRRAIRALAPRVVHVHSGGLLIHATDAVAVATSRVPCRVATLHSPFGWDTYPEPSRYQARWRRCSHAFHRVTAPSPGALGHQLEAGLAPSRLRTVPNAVEFDARAGGAPRDRARSQLGLAPGDFAVLFIGRLAAEKGLLDIVRGFALAAREDPAMRLVLAGVGELAERAREVAADERVADRVTWLGYRTDTEALRAAADAFLHPSLAESFGNSIVEAMAAGLPVITTRVGVVTTFDDSDAPFVLVEPGDPVAIGAALSRLRGGAAEARELGRRAREASAKFAPDAVAAEFAAVYAGVDQR